MSLAFLFAHQLGPTLGTSHLITRCARGVRHSIHAAGANAASLRAGASTISAHPSAAPSGSWAGPIPPDPVPPPNGIVTHLSLFPQTSTIRISRTVAVVRDIHSVSSGASVGINIERAIPGPTPSVRGTRPGRTPPSHSKAHPTTEKTKASAVTHAKGSAAAESAATSSHLDHASFSRASRRCWSASSCCWPD